MELRDYVRVFRLHLQVILLLMGIGLLVAWLVTIVSPREYSASATGMVRLGTATGPGELSLADSLAKSRAVSYVDVAKSRATAQRVIDGLGINTTPDALISHIAVTLPPDTVNLKIRATASTPQGAQSLADNWVKALGEQIAYLESPKDPSQSAIRVISVESAQLPGSPSSPNPVRNLAIGWVLGALAGGAYALVRSRIDKRIRDIDTVTRDFGVTVAGAIPSTPALTRTEDGQLPIVVSGKRSAGRSHAAESFFKIRTNLQFMDIDNPPRVIVVTSPLPGDGKSTVSGNLAAALAETGQSVILLDGDLRRPTVADAFGLVEGAGLTDLLTGKATFDDVAQYPTNAPSLAVIGAGSIPPNPSELLGSNVMRQMLQSMRRDHIIIIDAPPLLPVTDAAVLTANADGALVVITAGKTLDNQLDGALAHLEQVNGHVLGVIFNKVTTSSIGTYYGYYGYYGAYYGRDGAQGRKKWPWGKAKATTSRERSSKSPARRSESTVGAAASDAPATTSTPD